MSEDTAGVQHLVWIGLHCARQPFSRRLFANE